jgi:tetratricopeptide (TPR) repeat protein
MRPLLQAALLAALALPLRAAGDPNLAFERGLKAYAAGDLTQAAQSLNGLAEDHDLAPDARLYAGLLQAKLLLTGDPAAARQRLSLLGALGISVSAKAQVDYDLYYSYLLRNVAPHDSKASLELARRALALEPGSPDTRLNLLKSLLRRGWFLESARDAAGLASVLAESEAALTALDPGADKELASDVKNMLGQVLYLRHRYDEAVQAFDASQALSPRPANHRNIGWSLVLGSPAAVPCAQRLKALSRALAEFQEAGRLNDTNAATLKELGTLAPEVDRLAKLCGGH